MAEEEDVISTADEEGKDANAGGNVVNAQEDDQELEAMKARYKEMQEEAAKLKEMQKQVEEAMSTPAAFNMSAVNKEEADSRSIYIGNVDYSCTPEELQTHFKDCGIINRVTILCDKFTNQPKGFAYIEFASAEAIANAIVLDGSMLHNRQLKVSSKRTNLPGISSTNRPPRGFRARQMAMQSMYYPTYRLARPRFRSRRASFHRSFGGFVKSRVSFRRTSDRGSRGCDFTFSKLH